MENASWIPRILTDFQIPPPPKKQQQQQQNNNKNFSFQKPFLQLLDTKSDLLMATQATDSTSQIMLAFVNTQHWQNHQTSLGYMYK